MVLFCAERKIIHHKQCAYSGEATGGYYAKRETCSCGRCTNHQRPSVSLLRPQSAYFSRYRRRHATSTRRRRTTPIFLSQLRQNILYRAIKHPGPFVTYPILIGRHWMYRHWIGRDRFIASSSPIDQQRGHGTWFNQGRHSHWGRGRDKSVSTNHCYCPLTFLLGTRTR